MDMNYVALIGLIAGICTTISFLPQVIKTVRTKETKALSLPMYIVLALGMFLWTVYGIFIKDVPIVLANSISLMLALTVLRLKIKFG